MISGSGSDGDGPPLLNASLSQELFQACYVDKSSTAWRMALTPILWMNTFMLREKWLVGGHISTSNRQREAVAQTNGSRGPLFLITGGRSKMTALTCSNIDLESKLKRITAITRHNVLISQIKAWGPGRYNLSVSQEIYWKYSKNSCLDNLFLKSAW